MIEWKPMAAVLAVVKFERADPLPADHQPSLKGRLLKRRGEDGLRVQII